MLKSKVTRIVEISLKKNDLFFDFIELLCSINYYIFRSQQIFLRDKKNYKIIFFKNKENYFNFNFLLLLKEKNYNQKKNNSSMLLVEKIFIGFIALLSKIFFTESDFFYYFLYLTLLFYGEHLFIIKKLVIYSLFIFFDEIKSNLTQNGLIYNGYLNLLPFGKSNDFKIHNKKFLEKINCAEKLFINILKIRNFSKIFEYNNVKNNLNNKFVKKLFFLLILNSDREWVDLDKIKIFFWKSIKIYIFNQNLFLSFFKIYFKIKIKIYFVQNLVIFLFLKIIFKFLRLIHTFIPKELLNTLLSKKNYIYFIGMFINEKKNYIISNLLSDIYYNFKLVLKSRSFINNENLSICLNFNFLLFIILSRNIIIYLRTYSFVYCIKFLLINPRIILFSITKEIKNIFFEIISNNNIISKITQNVNEQTASSKKIYYKEIKNLFILIKLVFTRKKKYSNLLLNHKVCFLHYLKILSIILIKIDKKSQVYYNEVIYIRLLIYLYLIKKKKTKSFFTLIFKLTQFYFKSKKISLFSVTNNDFYQKLCHIICFLKKPNKISNLQYIKTQFYSNQLAHLNKCKFIPNKFTILKNFICIYFKILNKKANGIRNLNFFNLNVEFILNILRILKRYLQEISLKKFSSFLKIFQNNKNSKNQIFRLKFFYKKFLIFSKKFLS
ncbi:hypothetical protein (nucleomorph) [Guillardia theta]|uniref:Uncharacterized protein n=2 Tax=Guillardia theta TaxID=55529 RepID=Q98RS9_GUITH|nr:hypothetical protein GTHECHR1076 [Guillardia theta]AAK39868.1 hypothetical protein [Guillardia theta]